MDRLLNDGARNFNVGQPDQQPANPPPAPVQGQQPVPVMRQRQTGREDDDHVKSTSQSQDLSPFSQHSNAEMKSRNKANQEQLKLELIDQERFVYTREDFDRALEKGDAKQLVKMLRYGAILHSDAWQKSDAKSIAKKLFLSNQPALLAELIREEKIFQEGFIKIYKKYLSSRDFSDLSNFIKAMDDYRMLPKELKSDLLSRGLRTFSNNNNADQIQMVMQLEFDILQNKGHSGYGAAIKIALKNNKGLCETLIQNIFDTESRVKPDIKDSDCTLALGIALALRRLDWVVCLQDEILRREDRGVSDDSSAESSDDSSYGILGIELRDPDANEVMDALSDFIINVSPENFSKKKYGYRSTSILYGDESKSRDFLALQKLRQSLVEECIRPGVAEALAETGQQCYAAFVTHNDESDDSDESDEQVIEIIYPMVLKSLLASQLSSLWVEDADDLGKAQMLSLKNIGDNYIKNLLGSIPDLIDQCFESMNDSLELNSDRLIKRLMKNYGFPNSLAVFLAQSMSETMALQVKQPGLKVPEGLSALQVLSDIRRVVKYYACKAFKENFGVLIKKQQLITLFNKDAKGREDLWHKHFYAYLDVLKEGLLSPQKAN